MEQYGLVSVIMPAYNCEAFIAEAIQSVIQQTYDHWELLIIDDFSSDSTSEIIQEYAEMENRIIFLSNSTNKGTQHTRNKGINAAKGRFIAFLDADDRWKPKKLEKQLKFISEKGIAASFSSYELIDEKGSPLKRKIEALPVLTYQKLLKANYVGNLTGIYDISKVGKIFSPNVLKRQDWALWLEVIKKGGPMEAILEPLAYYRVRKGSLSTNKLEMLKYNFSVYYQILGYSYIKSCFKMLVFLREQIFIKSKQEKSV